MFKMGYYDTEFSTQHMTGENPFNDMVMVNGLIVPLSSIPIDLQEKVKKERAEGRDIKFTTKKKCQLLTKITVAQASDF